MNTVEVLDTEAQVTVDVAADEVEVIEAVDNVVAIEVPEQGPRGDAGASGARGATGATGIPGQTGATGSVGVPGPSGATGAAGALSWTYDATSQTMANPGPGKFRMNDTVLVNVTQIAISNVSADSLANLNSYLANVGLGQLSIIDAAGGSAAMFLTGLFFNPDSTGTGWVRFNVAFEGGPASLTGGNKHTLFFAPQGGSGATGSTGLQGSTGPLGPVGSTGATGAAGQLPWTYDGSSTTMANPGVGNFRLNNATIASVTQIAIANQCFPGTLNNLNGWLSNQGLGLLSITDPSTGKAVEFRTTGFTSVDPSVTGWVRFDVTYLGGNALTSTNMHYINLSPQGSTGFTGATGITGATGLTGATGSPGTLSWQYDDTSTSMASNPGTGKVRFNNADLSLATLLVISNQSLSSSGDNLRDVYMQAGFGKVTFTDPVNGHATVFSVTNVIDADATLTGYTMFAIIYLGGAHTFGSAAKLYASFAGARGSTGATGASSVFQWTYSSNTTMANPGQALFRADNLNLFSGSHDLAINNTPFGFIDSIGNQNAAILSYGAGSKLIIGSHVTGSTGLFVVNSITQQDPADGGWIVVNVTHVSGSYSFSAGQLFGLNFIPPGATGPTGATGSPGATGIQGATGLTGATGSPAGATGASGVTAYLNRFLNPGCEVDQRATAGSIMTVTTSGAFVIDGVIVLPTGASVTSQQDNKLTGATSSKSLKIIGATSVTNIVIRRRMSAIEAGKFAGKRVTVQAKVSHSAGVSVTPTLSVGHPTSADTYGGVGVASLTNELAATNLQSSTGALTTIAYCLDISTSATNGLEFNWSFGGSFNSNTKGILITDFDVRETPNETVGLVATPPVAEIMRHADALLECKEHFQRLWRIGSGNYYALCVAAIVSATAAYAIVVYPVPMRIAPQVNLSAPGDILIGGATANFTPTASAVSHVTEASALFTLTISGGSAQAGMCLVAYPGYIDLEAELI